MRYLELTPQHYEIVYNNILHASEGFDKYQIRVIAKLLDRLELLGVRQENGSYSLAKDCLISLDEVEYKIIEQINGTMKYNPRFAREAVKYLDWFSNASDSLPLRVVNDDQPAQAASQ